MSKVKQIAFVDEYYRRKYNATAAYRTVYGCSPRSARAAAARLKREPFVARYLELRQKEETGKQWLWWRENRPTQADLIYPPHTRLNEAERRELQSIRRRYAENVSAL